MNLSIVKKGLILAAIPLLAQLMFLGLAFRMGQNQLRAQQMAIHSKEVLAETEGFFRKVVEARAAVANLALAGDRSFFSAWEKSRHEAEAQLLALHNLVSDNPLQQTRIDRIIRQTEDSLTRLNSIAQLAQQPQTRNVAIAALGEPWTRGFVDDLRRDVNDFLHEEEHLDNERQMSLERVRKEETWALIGGALLALLSTSVLAFLFRQSISARLAVLMENVHRLAAGEQLATPLGGVDELGRLDRVFHEMAETLTQKDRENELFVYSVSHDLRSPLVNLQGFSQELTLVCQDLRRVINENNVPASVRERVASLLDRDADESIQFIQTAVRRLATIMDALLRLSRAGRVVFDWQQVDVRATIERVIAALGNTISQKGARVTVGEVPPAWGDPTAIEQIFANLLVNALNYLDPARPGIVEVGSLGTSEIDDRHTYYVKDNGLGIDPEYLPKIFLAFQRLHPTVAPGEGIGLPLVRRMVERHGGRLWVESVVNQGSTFFVSLPAPVSNGAAHIPTQSNVTRNESASGQSNGGEIHTWQQSRSA
ncbi:MAG TPA: ATP-binding protein [Gemmataceae bacterium]